MHTLNRNLRQVLKREEPYLKFYFDEREVADLPSEGMLFQRHAPLIDRDSLLMLDKAALICRSQEALI